MLLFIPCIQKSRKLFDCNEHILRAQYHGKCYFLHIQKLIESVHKAEQQKSQWNNRTCRSKHNSLALVVKKKPKKKKNLDRIFDKVQIFSLFQLVWKWAFFSHRSLNPSQETTAHLSCNVQRMYLVGLFGSKSLNENSNGCSCHFITFCHWNKLFILSENSFAIKELCNWQRCHNLDQFPFLIR